MPPPIKACSLVLIGMPASGKSTLASLLASTLGWQTVDTDDLIVQTSGCSLQDIVDAKGYLALREVEERAILMADFAGKVVATGGSAVYSEPAMRHLRQYGPLVFLNVPLDELQRRLGNFAMRGIAAAPGTDLAALYQQRQPLYERWADITIAVAKENETALAVRILQQLSIAGM